MNNQEVLDYHNFTWPSMPLSKRKKLHVGDIYINAILCKKCDYFVRSRNRHDMQYCKCGSCAVDGGSEYHKVTGNPNDYESILVQFENLDE